MKTLLASLSVASLLAACGSAPAPRSGLVAPLAIRKCEALAGLSIPPAAIALPTAGAIVASAERAAEVALYKDPEGETSCRRQRAAWSSAACCRSTSTAPPIQFVLNLPLDNWNGRALQSGGGGLGRQVITAPGNKASGRFDPNPLDVAYPIAQGYVTFASDQGHVRGDLPFTRNDKAMRN